jgi:ADP-ribosylglycohydrolase
MLQYTAIFDGYGFGFEYTSAEFTAKRNNMRTYQSHPRWKTKPGVYSDDTQMQMALAELMLRKPFPSSWSLGDVAAAFVECFKRDPRTGYAGGFYDFLVKIKTPAEFLMNIRPSSNKSGAAMRAPVLGLLADEFQVMDAAYLQGSLTHATPVGLEASAAAALLTHYTYHQLGPKADVGAYIEERVPGYHWHEGHALPVGSEGWEHVKAAIGAIQEHDSASTILKAIVGLTGDVDTAAAICAPAVYYSPEITNDIPASLIKGAENGPYGFDYLQDLGARLEAQFPRSPQVEDEDLIGDLFG